MGRIFCALFSRYFVAASTSSFCSPSCLRQRWKKKFTMFLFLFCYFLHACPSLFRSVAASLWPIQLNAFLFSIGIDFILIHIKSNVIVCQSFCVCVFDARVQVFRERMRTTRTKDMRNRDKTECCMRIIIYVWVWCMLCVRDSTARYERRWRWWRRRQLWWDDGRWRMTLYAYYIVCSRTSWHTAITIRQMKSCCREVEESTGERGKT